jgi:hypothetical protein
MSRWLTMKLSRRLKEARLWSGAANGTKLIFKNAAIQPVGWSARLCENVLADPLER